MKCLVTLNIKLIYLKTIKNFRTVYINSKQQQNINKVLSFYF